MGGGGVCLLHREVAIVPTTVQTLRVGPTTGEIFLKRKQFSKMFIIIYNLYVFSGCR